MDPAKTRKFRILQTGNHFENILLRTVLHLGLEPDDIIKRAKCVIAAQLHHSIGFV